MADAPGHGGGAVRGARSGAAVRLAAAHRSPSTTAQTPDNIRWITAEGRLDGWEFCSASNDGLIGMVEGTFFARVFKSELQPVG